MKLAVVAYLPPPRIGGAEAFRSNLLGFKISNQLFTYSEHNWPHVPGKCINPEILKRERNRWAINNLVFLIGLKHSIEQKFDYIIYIEADCRFGRDNWDRAMFDEFFSYPGPPLMGGTLVCFNPFNDTPEAARRFSELAGTHNSRKNYPLATYLPVQSFGGRAIPEKDKTCLFPMGALAIYHVPTLKGLFGQCELVNTAKTIEPFDKEIGLRMWGRFREGCFDNTVVLHSIYSSYGNVLTTEAERQQMLIRGEVVAIHQVKSQWEPDHPAIPVQEEQRHQAQTCIVQLGRIGDIINILPVAKHIYDTTQVKPIVLAQKNFAGVLDGVSYVEKEVWEGDAADAMSAKQYAEQKYGEVKVAQLWGKIPPFQRTCKNFMVEQWRMLGYQDKWGLLPVIFDNRDPVRESKLLHSIKTSKPIVLYNSQSLSFRFKYAKALTECMQSLGEGVHLIDLSEYRAERIYDLLALYERADCLITVDTATLQLARAFPIPVISILPDDPWQSGSYLDANVILEIRERNLVESIPTIKQTVLNLVKNGSDVAVISPGANTTGHGRLANDCIEALNAYGFRPTKYSLRDNVNTKNVMAVHCPHLIDFESWCKIKREKQLTFFYTWETSRIALATAEKLNNCQRVLTASDYNKSGYRASGVTTPIYAIGHGVDIRKYVARAFPEGPFVFGAAGNLEAGGSRKGFDLIINSFKHAFPNEPNVRLRIKLMSGQVIQTDGDHRIELLSGYLCENDLVGWLNGIHAFVNGSHAEGWGFWLHQAMACGRPVISSGYSGLMEFWTPESGYPVDFRLGAPDGAYADKEGEFAYLEPQSLSRAMVDAFRHRDEVSAKSELSIKLARRWDKERFSDRLATILQKPMPQFTHVYSHYMPDDRASRNRIENAFKQWQKQYGLARWNAVPIVDEQLPRLFQDNRRSVPYVSDIIEHAIKDMRLDHVLVLANSDIVPSPKITEKLIETFAHKSACFSYRRDIDEFRELKHEEILSNTDTYAGLDLFAFTKEWWLDHRHLYPDLLFATETWDYCLRLLMQEHGAQEFRDLIYHVKHEREGLRNKGSKSQLHNYHIAKPFLNQRNIAPYWESKVPINLNPA